MNSQHFKSAKLPDEPGVYFFRDKKGNTLYIGRATSLYDRVKSYFGNDLIVTRGLLLVDMVTKADHIEYQETDSVLEAIILESNLIKKHQPYFNTKEKDNKSYNYIIITDEESPRVMSVRERQLQTFKFKIKKKFGPYPQGTLIREALRIIRKIFPFRDAKSSIPHQESFYRSLGLSPTIDSLEEKKEYKKTIRNIILFFQGRKQELMKMLEKEMKEYASQQKFEKAQEVKRTLWALTHIQDVALIKADGQNQDRQGFRIEAYDIAHMSGKNTAGVMTVAYDGEMEKSEYRKFKISKEANDDVAGIKEMLIRRFSHSEWKFPDLVVIDGGPSQRNVAVETIGSEIPVVSVVKNDKHKADHILGDDQIIKIHKDVILKANAEAHRFAIAYHKNLRKRNFLKP